MEQLAQSGMSWKRQCKYRNFHALSMAQTLDISLLSPLPFHIGHIVILFLVQRFTPRFSTALFIFQDIYDATSPQEFDLAQTTQAWSGISSPIS